jgi:hypothetical protein
MDMRSKLMKSKLLGLFAVALMIVGMSPEKASANDGDIIGTIIGAATGGYIGSNVGKGKGKVVATAVGTLIGAAIGTEITRTTTHRRVTYPVYTPPPARRTVVHRTKVVKYVYVPAKGPKYKHHKRSSKWQKRQNRKHRRFADARSNNNNYGRDRRNNRSWN